MTERDPISTPALPGGLPFDATQIQFTQSGTGAVARSVQSKERDAISVLDFAANGVSGVAVDPTGVGDSTLGIQAAITALGSGDTLEFAPGSYKITSELQLFNVNRVRLVGKGTVTIVWSALSDATKACLKLKWAAYCEIVNLQFAALNGTHKPGFGVYITSEGAGGTNITAYNRIIDCGVTSASLAGVQVGNATVDADVNVDGTVITNLFATTCGTAIRVYGTNANGTVITRGSLGQSTNYGIEIGMNTRDVTIDNVFLANNGTYHIHVLKSIAGPISIKNMITELGADTGMFLQVDPQSGGITTYPLLSMENISCTNNTTTPALKIIDYQGSGSVAMRNCRFAGGTATSGGAGGTLSFRPANAGSPGAMLLLTEAVHLYDGCTFDVDTSFLNTAFMRWIDIDTVFGGSAQGDVFTNTPAVRLNGGIQLEVRYLLPLTLAAGMTSNQVGLVSRQLVKITIDKAAWTAAAVTQSLTLCTLPAKTRVVAAYSDTTIKYAGLAGTIQLEVGSAGGTPTDIILAHDVKTAAVTKGLLDADMGASMTRAAKIQDAFLVSFTGNTQPLVTLISSVGNLGTGAVTNLTTGSTTIYLITETMP